MITKATWGGAQRYVYDLATHLPKEQFEAIVAYGEGGELSKNLTSAGIEMHQITSLKRDVAFFSDIASFVGMVKCMRTVKPDVIHLNSSKAAALGAFAARLCGVRKIIFTVHGWPFKENRNAIARGLIYLISWLTELLSTATIVVSKSDEAQGKRMRFAGKNIHYIPIGIEPSALLPRDEATRSLLMHTDAPRIATIAELVPNKGIRYAIEAMALLKSRNVDVEYFVIGDGEQLTELVERAQKLDVAHRVHFLGFVPDASKYLKAFDLFLLPSVKEGMPYVLLEAAAANLPIITTTAVNPEFVERAENVFATAPGDPEAIANAIIETMLSKSERVLFPSSTYLFPLSTMIDATKQLYRLL